MKMLWTGACVALAGCALTMSGPASAAVLNVHDPAGDAPHQVDINSVRIVNSRSAVEIQPHFVHLNRASVTRMRVQIDVGKPMGFGYFIDVRKRAVLKWSRMYAEAPAASLPCKIVVTWGKDNVRITLPRTCMSKPNDERIRVEMSVDDRTGTTVESVPNAALFSSWVKRG